MALQAQQGATALFEKNYPAAIQHFTAALSVSPTSPDYFIKRSTAYQRSGQPELALRDAEAAVYHGYRRGSKELIATAQMRRGIALFGLKKFRDAKKCFGWVKKGGDDVWFQKGDGRALGLPSWEAKVEREIEKLGKDGGEERSGGDELVEVPKTDPLQNTATKADDQGKNGDDAARAEEKKAPEGVQTPANKIRHEWYQTSDTVVLTLLAKGVPKDKTTIDIQRRSVSISFPLPTSATYDFSLDPLFGPIDITHSKSSVMSTKIELILKKASAGQKWPSLEGTPSSPPSPTTADTTAPQPPSNASTNTPNPPPPSHTEKAPTYPTSSRTGPKNWDKLASDLTKKKPAPNSTSTTNANGSTTTTTATKPGDDDDDLTIDEDEDDTGGDPVNGFFKKLFRNADPDTRRAMMKSYQESNGTALSTNWAEVGKGKVETSPPEGMEARRWGE